MIKKISNNLGSLDVSSISDDVASLESKTDITSSFPSSLDAGVIDPISKLQAKVGVDGSADTNSLDYKVNNITAARDVFRIEPNVASLGTVTGVTTSTSTTTYYENNIDFSYGMTFPGYIELGGLSTAAYNDLSALSSGDTLTLGPWASTDGNPTSVTINYTTGSSGPGFFYVYYSSAASNFDEFYAQTSSSSDYVSFSSTVTVVTTDNSSLAFSQPHFEIGDLTPFVSADATVSSGTITLAGDLSSSISAGMSVVEKSYSSTGPKYVQYNLASGEYEDAKFASPSEFVATFRSSSGHSFNSTTNYVWGVTLIEFPSDWVEWVVDVDYELNLLANAAGTNIAYFRLRWMPNPTTVTASTMVTLNESNTWASQLGGLITYNASDLVGSYSELLYLPAVTDVVGVRNSYSLPYIRHSNMNTYKVTTAAIYCYFDPRYNGSAFAPRATVSVRRVK